MTDPAAVPLELTAPAIQRIARKGLAMSLSDAERIQLCECILFHVDAILKRRRVPKVGSTRCSDDVTRSS